MEKSDMALRIGKGRGAPSAEFRVGLVTDFGVLSSVHDGKVGHQAKRSNF